MMLDGLSPAQDPVLAPDLGEDPIGPWVEKACIHVQDEESCHRLERIENYWVNVSRTGGIKAMKASSDADKTHRKIHLR